MEEVSDDEYVICPYCGHQHGDAWEWCREEMEEVVCDACEKTFYSYALYSVTYYSRPVQDDK